MSNAVVEKIIKEIEAHVPSVESEHVGRVTSVGDGVVAIDGLSKAVMSEIILFEEGKGKPLAKSMEAQGELYGVILNLEEDGVRAAILGDTARVEEGMTVKSTGRIFFSGDGKHDGSSRAFAGGNARERSSHFRQNA